MPVLSCEGGGCAACGAAPARTRRLACELLDRLPAIRDALFLDVQAAYDGDPAASNLDEVILAYPGVLAVTVYRVAHELHVMGVPLMPRIMTRVGPPQTRRRHPPRRARSGASFFIDHATGVVVGETTHDRREREALPGRDARRALDPAGRARPGHPRHQAPPDGRGRRDRLRQRDRARRRDRPRRGQRRRRLGVRDEEHPAGSRVAVKPPETRVVAAGSHPGDEEYPTDFEI